MQWSLLTSYEKGLRVPEDIAVVGMDDLDIAQYFKPALTTVQTLLENWEY